MDNLTHSCAAVLIAEAACQIFEKKTGNSDHRLRRIVYLTSIVANSLPDVDFLYDDITGGKLGYLLHHRGHTHTFAAILPLALVVLVIPWLVAKFSKVKLARPEWSCLFGVGLIGGITHIALDFLNSYGVHPFWPLSNRWYYGDTLFILDPGFWIITACTMIFLVQSGFARLLWVGLLTLSLGLVWETGYVPGILVGSVTVLAVTGLLVSWMMTSKQRIISGLTIFLMAILGFASVSGQMRVKLSAHFSRAGELHDLVLSPQPVNPLCWNFMAVRSMGDIYRVDVGLATYGLWLTPDGCKFDRSLGDAINVQGLSSTDPSVDVAGGFVADIGEMKRLYVQSCRFRALLRFARVPYWRQDAEKTIIGDMRFDREKGLGFAEMLTMEGEPCPKFLPPWEEPNFLVKAN
jgi:inner membrane protein